MKSKKNALGRGLQAILESPETDITSKDISGGFVVGAIAEIPLNKIEPNPFQPRKDFDQHAINELHLSILEHGIIQPITVRKLGFDQYQIISGERRWRASHLAELETIPAYIKVANDEEMLEIALIENIHRENLNPIEIAISYKRLLDECQLTHEELSCKVGKNRSTITNFIRLLKLPTTIQLSLKENEITIGHARALINAGNEEQQLELFNLITSKNLSVRQLENIIRRYNTEEQTTPAKKAESSTKNKSYQDSLSKIIGTKVEIKSLKNGNGKVVINYKSDEDLERIVTLLEK